MPSNTGAPQPVHGPIRDPQVRAVIDDLHANARYPEDGGPRRRPDCDPADYANGGGLVIGAELVPAKVDAARENLARAGLEDYAEIRKGDARQTLRDLGGPVDFALIDGWPSAKGPSPAREVIEIVAPQLRVGGYVMNDNAEPDFLEFIRDPANGFLSLTLPLKGGAELAVKVQ